VAYSTPATQTTGDVIGATAWNVLVANSKWGNEIDSTGGPTCWVSRSSTVAIPNAAITSVTWNSHAWDNAGIHSTSVNPNRFTAPIDGVYLAHLWINWDANGTGIRVGEFLIDGVDLNASDVRTAVPGFTTGQGCTGIVSLSAGHYIEAVAYQSSGGSLSIGVNSFVYFQWIRKHP
jgi:hypothetical protein